MNPQDTQTAYETVMCANIDIGCNDKSTDIVKVSNRVVDDEGNVSSQIFDKHEEWSHDEYFQVKFDGKPYRIAPGRTALLPRFVAEHFAKHLADHMLMKKEDLTQRRGLVTSPIERPIMLKQILTDVNTEVVATPLNTVDQTLPIDTEPADNQGVIPNPAVGELKPEPPTLRDILVVAGENPDKVDRIPVEETSIVDEKKPLPTRKQLIELCYNQSIDITGAENKAELIEKLKRG